MSSVHNFSSLAVAFQTKEEQIGSILYGQILANALTTVFTALLMWRAWKFTISPMLYPQYPRELPYWIPYFGHAHAFFKDSNELLQRARKCFNYDEEPFALTAFGVTFYVVTQAKHSAAVYKNNETLSFEDFVQVLMKTNGSSDEVIQKMYSPLPVDKSGFPNPQGESLGVLAQKMHIHQLHPGQNLLDLQHKALAWIDRDLHRSLFPHESTNASSQGPASVEVPLYKWCSDFFIRLGQHIYFGDILQEIDPLLSETFFNFDEVIWKMLYQYPDILSGDMTVQRARIISSLKKYFEVPQEQRKQTSAWLINAWEDEARALGVDDDNLAVLVFFLYFAINTNSRKTAFWVLTYLLHNPSSMDAFRQETAPAFNGTDLVDPFYIQDPEKCPQVDHIWHETLRLSGWSASVRLITEDTVIGGKLMRKGNRVMVPHRLLHFEEGTFGEKPHEFHPERWEQHNLTRSPSWRPFGAGKTMCSGRYLARFNITTFVATLLQRYDLGLVGNPPFPKKDEGRPVLGTLCIKEGSDFKVRISTRATKT